MAPHVVDLLWWGGSAHFERTLGGVGGPKCHQEATFDVFSCFAMGLPAVVGEAGWAWRVEVPDTRENGSKVSLWWNFGAEVTPEDHFGSSGFVVVGWPCTF